jgi:hypothetical protein
MRGLCFVGCLLLGCTGSEDPVDAPPDGDAPVAELFGAVSVALREATATKEAFGLVSGTVYDGPSPLDLGMETVLSEGECELREPTHPFCDPPCDGSALCVRDGECMPYPKAQDVGELQVTGLSVPLTMPAFAPNFRYESAELQYPPCEEGAPLRLEAERFEAETRCVAPLVVDPDQPIRVRADEPVSLSWAAPGDADLARVEVFLDISHHGGKRGDILCDVPDTGQYEIPATLVSALVDLGLAGYPSVILTRRTSAVSNPPDVEFRVSASVERAVDTGVVSCVPGTAEDCPDDQTCDPASNVCR